MAQMIGERAQTTLCLLIPYFLLFERSAAKCLSNDEYNEFFANGTSIPREGSCCQFDVCGIPCPSTEEPPQKVFGIVVAAGVALSCIVGLLTYFFIKGQAVNFFVAGRSLPLFVVAMTLAAQSIDSNALLGNADLSYKYHFYDGAVLPIGLGLSLILNGAFLAHKINEDNVLTLPDVYAKRYGSMVEILTSCATIISFMMLLAGNLVGMGAILSYLWNIEASAAIWISAAIVWFYTMSGGLFSVAFTDVVQGIIGWSGCLVAAFYLIRNAQPASTPSIGLPGYVYPNEEICNMYDGVPCDNDPSQCCYNIEKWCPSDDNCRADNAAYPIGDMPVFPNQLTDHLSLTPFPNAIMWNWATIFILAFGNLAALDFQARCMAAKTATTARLGCLIGGCLTFLVGIPFAYLGAITRVHYGPDSAHASFEADSCSTILGLPTCALWNPDPQAFLKLLTHQAPAWVGAWCLLGIVCASMSTADGAILAMGTVFSHNVVRQIGGQTVTKHLLAVSRFMTLPFALSATLIANYYRSDHPQGATGYLLIVAFDVVLATVVAPLFGAFYCKTPRPNAALFAILVGGGMRVALELTIPKDGFLLLPYKDAEFQDVGSAASTAFPTFFDVPASDMWNPQEEQCQQRQFEDYTGVDSLASFLASVLVFVTVQFLERNGPMFVLPFQTPYDKLIEEEKILDETVKDLEMTANRETISPDRSEGVQKAQAEPVMVLPDHP